MYQSEQSLGKLITIASLVALLIAIIGIIGLVFFETQFIRKEIAVRRVNGATVGSILKMINKKYLIMAGASFVIAAPVAYWLMTAWRKGFAYQADLPRCAARRGCHHPGCGHAPKLESGQCQPCRIVKE